MPDQRPEILNVGLDLAMEFGASWLQPIQPRLAKRHPELTAEELDAYEATCRAAMTWAQLQVPELWHAAGGKEREARRLFETSVGERYPWISAGNLSHLFTQGRYYAWKDGLLG
ncbi:MAG TPA: hypothetical protein VF006_28190 [Longimicrobium sp.]